MPGKDDYPQSLIFTTNPITTTNEWTSVTAEIPLMNLPNAGKNSARVIELVKIKIAPIISASTNTYMAFGGVDYAGNSTTLVPLQGAAQDIRNFLFQVMVPYGTAEQNMEIDLTINGKGLLFPGPQIVVNTISATTLNYAYIQVMYRVKNVPLSEWVGIVNQYQLQHATL